MTSIVPPRAAGLAHRVPHLGVVARVGIDSIRWVGGITLATVRYATRRVPVRRTTKVMHGQPPAPMPVQGELAVDLQRRRSGVGSAWERTYRARITGSSLTPEQVIDRVASNLNGVSPVEVAWFDKERGVPAEVEVGDEYTVHLPGPWNGPVRVIERTDRSFRFATLKGHMEAGQISFTAMPGDNGELMFEIHSVARSGDSFFRVLYDIVPVAKEMQLHMWVHFCQRVAVVAGGELVDGVEVISLRYVD